MDEREPSPPEEPRPRRQPTWDPRVLRDAFTGTALQRASFELDAAYYGAAHENRSRATRHALRTTLAWLRQIGLHRYGPATPSPEADEATLNGPGPQYEDAVAWIQHLDALLEPTSLPTSDWEFATCWRLDALHAVAELAPSRWRLFNLFSLGFERDEIAFLMPTEGGEPWQVQSVRRALRETSNHVRHKAEMRLLRRGAEPQPGTPTSIIGRVEADLVRQRARVDVYRQRLEAHQDQERQLRAARRRREERARIAEARRLAGLSVGQSIAEVVDATRRLEGRGRRLELARRKDKAA